MQHYRASNYGGITPMVKNILIINVIMLIGSMLVQQRGIDISMMLGMHHPQSAFFKPWQLLTHVFMHANAMHLLSNMLGLYFFGTMLEMRWGGQRFLKFYLITALAAAALHIGVLHYRMLDFLNNLTPEQIEAAFSLHPFKGDHTGLNPSQRHIAYMANVPMVGASGAIFGILGACLIYFPNTTLYLIFPPIPIKLKYAVTFYGIYELINGIQNNAGDNVAHFAHLGGLVAGILIVKYWNKTRRDRFY